MLSNHLSFVAQAKLINPLYKSICIIIAPFFHTIFNNPVCMIIFLIKQPLEKQLLKFFNVLI